MVVESSSSFKNSLKNGRNDGCCGIRSRKAGENFQRRSKHDRRSWLVDIDFAWLKFLQFHFDLAVINCIVLHFQV